MNTCMESIEIETRYRVCNSDDIARIRKILGGELVSLVHGTDTYWGYKQSKKDGIWRRIRHHRVYQNGSVHPYQVRQVKTHIPSPPNPYGIECWLESDPIPVNASDELENLRKQGHPLLYVRVVRQTYSILFDGIKIEVNIDIGSSPEGLYIENAMNINNRSGIPQSTESLVRYNEEVSKIFKSEGIVVQVMPTYQEILSNGTML